jgi:hypothetical protein
MCWLFMHFVHLINARNVEHIKINKVHTFLRSIQVEVCSFTLKPPLSTKKETHLEQKSSCSRKTKTEPV